MTTGISLLILIPVNRSGDYLLLLRAVFPLVIGQSLRSEHLSDPIVF
jgi:hypothetical protein